jgi:hypothetical protein
LVPISTRAATLSGAATATSMAQESPKEKRFGAWAETAGKSIYLIYIEPQNGRIYQMNHF